MSITEEERKKRVEQRERDAVKDGLRSKEIPKEKYTHESAKFINFGLRLKKQRDKRKRR